MNRSKPFRSEAASSHPSEFLRAVISRNRRGEAVGIYAVCSAHPAVIDAAIQQALGDGGTLHIESTSSQVNQFGGYTGSDPAQFAEQIRKAANAAGLPPERVLLGADHLGPYCWRAEPAEVAMSKACELARQSVLAGYQKIHLDASMPCGGDPAVLEEPVVAERAAVLCHAAEQALVELPAGTPPPLYVIGTEVPAPGGEVAEGEGPRPTRIEDVQRTLGAFRKAFRARGLESAWENVVGLVVQPGVEFGDSSVFEYDRTKARDLATGLPSSPELVYEAHSTDYQTPAALAQLVEDHFAILKVGPALTFAYREAVFALGMVEREMPEHRRSTSQVREALEAEMLRKPAHWRPYFHGSEEQQRFARAFSLSDRCRYYWPQPALQEEVNRLLSTLGGALPMALLSQYLPCSCEAIRTGVLENRAPAIIRHHIQRVLNTYAAACGARTT